MNNAGSVISLTHEQVIVHSDTLNSIAEDLRAANSMLQSMHDETLVQWQGKAKNDFTNAFETFKPSLEQAASILSVLSQKLKATADVVKHLDQGV